MSLRGRLLATIAAALVASLMVEAAVVYLHARAKVENEVTAAMAVGRSVAQRALVALPGAAQPYEHLLGVVRTFDGDRHLRATLVSAGGEVVAASQLSRQALEAPEWLVRLLDPPRLEERLETPSFLTSYGAVALESDPRSEVAEVWTEALTGAALTAAFFAAVLALVHVIIGRAVAPLANLAEAFESVGEGRFSVRLAETGPSELARLYHGFNRMTDRLAEAGRRNAALTEQLITIQDEERADLARDLHDDVSPYLFSVDVDASAIAKLAEEKGDATIAGRAREVRDATLRMKRDVRAIIGKLRPSNLEDLGLIAAVEGLASFWRVRRPEIRFDLRLSRDARAEGLDDAVFYVVREAIANAVKHGSPSVVSVWIETGERELVAVIEDDGDGMSEPRSQSEGHGYGLLGVAERVEARGGALEITPRSQRGGVILTARFPLAASGPAPKQHELEDVR